MRIEKSNFQALCQGLILLNIVNMVFGTLYFASTSYSIIWDIFGIIMVFTWIADLVFVIFNKGFLKQMDIVDRKVNLYNLIFIVLIILSMLGFVLGNLYRSILVSPNIILNFVPTIIVASIFYVISCFAIYLSFLNIKRMQNPNKDIKRSGNSYPLLRKGLVIICYLTLLQGMFWLAVLYFGYIHLFMGFWGMFVGQSAPFLAFIYLATAFLLLRLKGKDYSPSQFRIIFFTGITIGALYSVPLFLTPISISNAELEFSDAFGEDWQDEIPDDIKQYFLSAPYSLARNYLGVPNRDVKVVEHVNYYKDDELELYFDVFMPKEQDDSLPGKNSIIISIHGGGWQIGDKSWANMLSLDKYLASQGYVVFEIQYPLRNRVNFMDAIYFEFPDSPLSAAYKSGDYTVEDQIKYIGLFSKKLADEYAEDYNGDLNNVYLMGGSAGAHLASVFAFGYNEEYFNGTFSDELNIKAVIPYYPATDTELYFDTYMPDLLEGDPESDPEKFKMYDPSQLIDSEDPPAIIFHGTNDGMAVIKQSRVIEKEMDENELICVRILFPLAGHMNEYMHCSNFAQVWTYYLERFLYLTK